MNSLNFPVQRGRLPPLDGNSSTHLRRHYPLLPRRGNNYLNFVLEIIFLVSCMLLELFSHLKSEPGKRWFPIGAMGFPCEWRSLPATILVPVHLVRRDICSKSSLRSHLLKSKFEITFAQVGDPLPRCLDGAAGPQPTRCHHHLCCRTHNCPGKFLWDCIVANLKPTNIHFDPGQRPGPARLPCLVPWPQPHTHFGKRTSYWVQAFFLDTLIL